MFKRVLAGKTGQSIVEYTMFLTLVALFGIAIATAIMTRGGAL